MYDDYMCVVPLPISLKISEMKIDSPLEVSHHGQNSKGGQIDVMELLLQFHLKLHQSWSEPMVS